MTYDHIDNILNMLLLLVGVLKFKLENSWLGFFKKISEPFENKNAAEAVSGTFKKFSKTILDYSRFYTYLSSDLISEINQANESFRNTYNADQLGRFHGKLSSDPGSSLSQESSGPFSPLGVRVGARVVGLV